MKEKAYLVLENGAVFEGFAFGATGECKGELVFTTGVCGYNDTLTDPAFCGQIVMQTFPLIGNYGVISEAFEGKPAPAGYVVREWCETPSNFRSEGTLDEFLKANNIPAIYGVDTRAVTRVIRENGVMNAKICKALPKDFDDIKNYKICDAVKQVSCDKTTVYTAEKEKFKVVLIDYGVKNSLISALSKRGCTVTLMPYNTMANDVLATNCDGIVLSSGPSDPACIAEEIEVIRELAGKKPILAVGLGAQLLALSQGAKTRKLKYGHRGANQPVRDTAGTRTFITSQNHGYEVVSNSIKNGVVSLVNANDGSVEGIDYPEIKAVSVQFYPDSNYAEFNTAFVYDRFLKLMEE